MSHGNNHWVTTAGITRDEFQRAMEQVREQLRSGGGTIFLTFDESVEIKPDDWHKLLKTCPMEVD